MSEETQTAEPIKKAVPSWHHSVVKKKRTVKARVVITNAHRLANGRFRKGAAVQLKYRSARKLKKDLDLYFEECYLQKKVPTLSGLALWLGVTKPTLLSYGKGRYADEVGIALMRIESGLEQKLISGKECSVAGVALALKQMGWTDKAELLTKNKSISLTGFTLVHPNDERKD